MNTAAYQPQISCYHVSNDPQLNTCPTLLLQGLLPGAYKINTKYKLKCMNKSEVVPDTFSDKFVEYSSIRPGSRVISVYCESLRGYRPTNSSSYDDVFFNPGMFHIISNYRCSSYI